MPRKQGYRKRKYYNKKKKEQRVISTGDKEVTITGTSSNKPVIYRGIGIPSVFMTKLKYSSTVVLSGIPFDYYTFRGNSVYDPDYTGTGTQPLYYDELTALYRSYTVLGSEIQVTFSNRTSSGNAQYTRVGIYPLSDQTPYGNIDICSERDNCIYSTLGPPNGDQGIINMKSYGKTVNILGMRKDESTDDAVTALVTANPQKEFFWVLWAGSLDALTNISVYATITMTYYVRFSDRYNVDGS